MEKVKHRPPPPQEKEIRRKGKEHPRARNVFDDSLGVVWQFFLIFRNRSSVWSEDYCRTRCKASLEHDFESLQGGRVGGVSVVRMDMHLK